MFPVDPEAEHASDSTRFIVQDPEMRSKVLPLFAFDPGSNEERPIGHGTAFRIDPWTRCATAFHVLEDLLIPNKNLTGFELKPNLRIAALDMGGIIAWGSMPLPIDAWRPINGAFLPGGIHTPPTFTEPPRVHNLTELCALRILPRQSRPNGTPFLPVKLQGWQPKVGEAVLALGYPNLDLDQEGEIKEIAESMEMDLYASFGNIIQVEPADPSSSRPWPIIRVDVEWSGGMSGGPVINSDGNVVGLVSTGVHGDTIGTANIFSGWGVARHVYASLDPNNPGWFGCYGAFDDAGKLCFVDEAQEEVQRRAKEHGFTDIRKITRNWLTDDYINR